MIRQYIRWCELCGVDFKARSPFAQSCPKCKLVRFKKPGPEPKKIVPDITLLSKITELAIKR